MIVQYDFDTPRQPGAAAVVALLLQQYKLQTASSFSA